MADVDDLARWLYAQGVPDHLDRPPLGPVKTGRVSDAGDGLFDFDPAGEWAFLHPILDTHYDAYDVVAWTRAAPIRTLRLTGLATWLGEGCVALAETQGWRIKLHATPLAWLKASGDGAVMLEPASCRYELLLIDTLLCATKRQAEDVDQLIKGPERALPRIKVARA